MEEALNPRLEIGGNRPPAMENALADLREALQPFEARRAELLQAFERMPEKLLDRDHLGKAADFVGIARDVGDRVEAERKRVSEPLHAAHRAVIAERDRWWSAVDEVIAKAVQRIDAFRASEEEARTAQEREQREQEAAARAAAAARSGPRPMIDYTAPAAAPVEQPAAPPAPARPVRGDLGYAVRDKGGFDVAIVDVGQIPRHILESDTVKDAIAKVIASQARHIRVVPGATITPRRGSRVNR